MACLGTQTDRIGVAKTVSSNPSGMNGIAFYALDKSIQGNAIVR